MEIGQDMEIEDEVEILRKVKVLTDNAIVIGFDNTNTIPFLRKGVLRNFYMFRK